MKSGTLYTQHNNMWRVNLCNNRTNADLFYREVNFKLHFAVIYLVLYKIYINFKEV